MTLKHVTDIVGTISPVVTALLTFATVVVAVVGWSEAARRNGEEARRTESANQEHARQGTRRQVRTLLRDAVSTIEPFSYLAPQLHLDDVARTYERFVDRLNERETAIALLDHEYDALDAFVAKFGRMIALAQQHVARSGSPTSAGPPPRATSVISIYDPPAMNDELTDSEDVAREEEWEKNRRRFFDERRLFFVDCFRDTLPQLGAALAVLGDDEMRNTFERMVPRAEQTAELLRKRLYPEIG